MATRTDLSELNATAEEFRGQKFPLTKHMLYAWHRYDMRRQFHLNSGRNRLAFQVWYFVDHLPTKPYDVGFDNRDLIEPLNAGIMAAGPMTVFLQEVWRTKFADNPAFDIFTHDGYVRFATWAIEHLRSQSGLLPLVTPGLIAFVQRPANYGGGHAVSLACECIWKDVAVYRNNYVNLPDWQVREAFNFDLLLHKYVRDGIAEIFAPETIRYWSSPAFKQAPRLSRFVACMASLSRRFGGQLTSESAIIEHADAIESWYQGDLLPKYPRLALLGGRARDLAGKGSADDTDARKRAALYGIASLPGDSDDEIDMLVVGPYAAASGLGTGMRRSIDALLRANCNFRVLNFMYENPSPHLESIPEHLQYRGERAKATLWHFNGEYLPEAMQTLPSLVNPNYNIGYFFWETEACPQAHELACAMLDEIWVPSDFVRKCYSVARVPVTVVGTSVELPEVAGYLPRSYFGLDDGFLFLFTFDAHSVIHRKNPAAVVRAFQKAFTEDDTRLVIKTQNFGSAHWGEINGRSEELLELCESDPRVRLMDVTLSLHELYSLKMACDSYVSLHRSEGFGYGPAEAMALGKPVIMTNYSANAEFGADGASLLVDAKLVHVLHGEYLYWSPEMMWAEPSLDHAASLMRKVYEDRTFAADLGKRGQERIVKEFGPEAMARKYAARLRELGI